MKKLLVAFVLCLSFVAVGQAGNDKKAQCEEVRFGAAQTDRCVYDSTVCIIVWNGQSNQNVFCHKK